jgi:hypothetical protein
MWRRVHFVWLHPPAHAISSLAVFFYPEDGGDTFLPNVGSHNFYRRHIPENGILQLN